jgi:FMN phosphatase YigB (HAD superfamily)
VPEAPSDHLPAAWVPGDLSDDGLMVPVVLVDFGNTLADETFMWRDVGAFADWTAHYGPVVRRLAHDWHCGRSTTDVLAAAIAASANRSRQDVRAHMALLCSRIAFYPGINTALDRRRARGALQAIVTVNPDLFSMIAVSYDLASRFDAIVTSWEIGTTDKVAICQAACEQVGCAPRESALIDNTAENVERWIEAGGGGYVFRSDEQFIQDIEARRVPGFEPADVAPR